MAQKSIPAEVKKQLEAILRDFNQNVLQDTEFPYVVSYRGQNAYFGRRDFMGGGVNPRFRLQYTGKMDDWKFAIYKYSSNRYDPDDWVFPGFGYVDGTVEGALKAGLEAYS
jgi:hypothetical protein